MSKIVRHLGQNWAWYALPPVLFGVMALLVALIQQGQTRAWWILSACVLMMGLYVWALRVNVTRQKQPPAPTLVNKTS